MLTGAHLMTKLLDAQDLLEAGQNKQALQAFQKAVEATPEDSEDRILALNHLGMCYDDLQSLNHARETFQQAQKLSAKKYGEESPPFALALANESMLYLNRGQRAKGAPMLERASQILCATNFDIISTYSKSQIEAFVSVLCNAATDKAIHNDVKGAIPISKAAFSIAEKLLTITDPVYLQAGFELGSFLANAGKRKEEAALREKLMTKMLGDGTKQALDVVPAMRVALNNIMGQNARSIEIEDFAGASNIVPFSRKGERPGSKPKASSPPSEKKKATKPPAGLQLKISLDGVKPPIWRRITIETDVSLYGLHNAIQAAMGWTDSHLHEFRMGSYAFGDARQDPSVNEENQSALEDLDIKVGSKFLYLYDFGDGWEHTITVEKFLTAKEIVEMPMFLEAKGACPPQDCGGPPGFMSLLRTLNSGIKLDAGMSDWLEMKGALDYDPERVPECFSEKPNYIAEPKAKQKSKGTARATKVKAPKVKETAKAKAKSTAAEIKATKLEAIAKAVAEEKARKKTGKIQWPGAE